MCVCVCVYTCMSVCVCVCVFMWVWVSVCTHVGVVAYFKVNFNITVCIAFPPYVRTYLADMCTYTHTNTLYPLSKLIPHFNEVDTHSAYLWSSDVRTYSHKKPYSISGG